MEKLYFAAPYPPILFTGEKYKTFRLAGSSDKYSIGDLVSMCYPDDEEFAQSVVCSKYRKKFKDLTEEDWKGHERFESEETMYKTYENWNKRKIGPETEMDIIVYKDFKLTGKPRKS